MRKYPALNIYNLLMSASLWAIILLIATQCACGAVVLPTESSVNTEQLINTYPAKSTASAEPTDAAQVWRVTEALTVRSCASVDCKELEYIKAGSVVIPMPSAISGAGCIGGGWVAIVDPAGFVCNLYLEER